MTLRHRPYLAALAAAGLLAPALAEGQEVISGKFYRFEVVGRAGLGEVTSVLAGGPSVNDLGQVAFAAQSSGFNAVFVSDLGAAAPRKVAQQNVFSFLGGIKINNSQHVIALDQSSIPEPSGFRRQYLRDYNAAPPGPYPSTLIAGATDPSFNDFRQIRFEASLNNAGQPAFSALRYLVTPPGATMNALVTGTRLAGLNRTDLAHPLRPMIADDGRVVVRAGAASSSPIRLYNHGLTTFETIAQVDAIGFSALGQSPDVSDDGRIVVFYGDHRTLGAGVFASLDVGTPPRRLVKIAGREVEELDQGGNDDGVCDGGEICQPGELGFDLTGNALHFASFDPDARVGVTHVALGAAGLADDTFVVSFLATPNGGGSSPSVFAATRGLWTIRVDMKQVGAAIIEKPSMPQPVVQAGDRLGSRSVVSVQVYDPVAAATVDDLGLPRTQRRGDHRVAFQALTDAGGVIVRASHFDSDEDGLLDHWESTGVDFNTDGTIDLPLHQAPFSANPLRKDIFVEIDFLVAADHSHRPIAGSLTNVESAFAAAPVANPDSSSGIAAHVPPRRVDRGSAIPSESPLPGAAGARPRQRLCRHQGGRIGGRAETLRHVAGGGAPRYAAGTRCSQLSEHHRCTPPDLPLRPVRT